MTTLLYLSIARGLDISNHFPRTGCGHEPIPNKDGSLAEGSSHKLRMILVDFEEENLFRFCTTNVSHGRTSNGVG